MKKFIFAVFIFVACFALCGCKSHEVKEAEDQIDSIGEITTESGLAISEAEEAYAALSADEQKDVWNGNQNHDRPADGAEKHYVPV